MCGGISVTPVRHDVSEMTAAVLALDVVAHCVEGRVGETRIWVSIKWKSVGMIHADER